MKVSEAQKSVVGTKTVEVPRKQQSAWHAGRRPE